MSPSPSAVLWLADNYQSATTIPEVPGVSPEIVRRITHQMAIWVINEQLTVEQIRASGLTPTADQVARLVEQALQQQLPMRQVVQAPLIELLVIDQRFDGDRFRARVTDGASDSPVANALVTFSIDGEPVRVLETHENGTTDPLDLDARNEQLGAVRAAVSLKMPAGTLVRAESSDGVLITSQALAFQVQSDAVRHRSVNPFDVTTSVPMVTRDFMGLIRSSQLRLVFLAILVGLALWWVVGGKEIASKGKRFGIILLGGLVVIVGLYIYVISRDQDRIDATWADSIKMTSEPVELHVVGASATSEFNNGEDVDRYGPACVIPGAAAQSGRPWMSARGAGMPQVLRLDLGQPNVVSAVRLEPGWTNGLAEDFVRAPRPVAIDIVSEAGVVQSPRLSQAATFDEASQAAFVGVEPFVSRYVYVMVQRVEGAADDRVAIGEVQFLGYPTEFEVPERHRIDFLAGVELRTEC